VAPELALPSRIMKGLRAHALHSGTEQLGQALEGWRQLLLAEPLARFAAEFPLKS